MWEGRKLYEHNAIFGPGVMLVPVRCCATNADQLSFVRWWREGKSLGPDAIKAPECCLSLSHSLHLPNSPPLSTQQRYLGQLLKFLAGDEKAHTGFLSCSGKSQTILLAYLIRLACPADFVTSIIPNR